MDEELKAFRERSLGKIKYIYVDARYEKVRHGGNVRDLAILSAIGVNEKGKREVLGVSVSLSEAEVHWRRFFEDLQKRGMNGLELLISDDHSGLGSARRAVFPSVPWQRCTFHMAQTKRAKTRKKKIRESRSQILQKNCCTILVMTINHEDLVDTLNRLMLTTIRDKLDNLLDEASRKNMNLREALAFFCKQEIQ